MSTGGLNSQNGPIEKISNHKDKEVQEGTWKAFVDPKRLATRQTGPARQAPPSDMLMCVRVHICCTQRNMCPNGFLGCLGGSSGEAFGGAGGERNDDENVEAKDCKSSSTERFFWEVFRKHPV